ncbi:hypothetical protein ACXIVK_36060 [Paraburkholderia caledonica]
MKRASDVANQIAGDSAAQKRMATALMRAAGMVRSAIEEGVFDDKERKALLDAIAVLERGAKVRRQAASLKSKDEQAAEARRKDIRVSMSSTFAALSSIEEKVALIAAVDSDRLKHAQIRTPRDVDDYFKESLNDLEWKLARRDGDTAEVVTEAWTKFCEARQRLQDQHALVISRVRGALSEAK